MGIGLTVDECINQQDHRSKFWDIQKKPSVRPWPLMSLYFEFLHYAAV